MKLTHHTIGIPTDLRPGVYNLQVSREVVQDFDQIIIQDKVIHCSAASNVSTTIGWKRKQLQSIAEKVTIPITVPIPASASTSAPTSEPLWVKTYKDIWKYVPKALEAFSDNGELYNWVTKMAKYGKIEVRYPRGKGRGHRREWNINSVRKALADELKARGAR
jgi:hypothetical protein